jgi:hypothetical protein
MYQNDKNKVINVYGLFLKEFNMRIGEYDTLMKSPLFQIIQKV